MKCLIMLDYSPPYTHSNGHTRQAQQFDKVSVLPTPKVGAKRVRCHHFMKRVS